MTTNYQLIIAAWNKGADEFNQWGSLSEEEKIEYAYSVANEWQPMKSAPTDGTYVLFWEEHDPYPRIGYWSNNFASWRTRSDNFFKKPNGWMPLPAAPSEETK